METTVEQPKEKPKKPVTRDQAKEVVRVLDVESTRLLNSIREKANKKSFGRKIRDGEIIHKGLSLISSVDIEALQEASLSELDRLKMAHEEYVRVNGKTTYEQFIGLLLKGQIQKNN